MDHVVYDEGEGSAGTGWSWRMDSDYEYEAMDDYDKVCQKQECLNGGIAVIVGWPVQDDVSNKIGVDTKDEIVKFFTLT